MLYSRVVKTLIRVPMVIVGATLFLAAAGCGDDDEATPSATSEGTATASSTEEPFSGDRDPVEGTPRGSPPLGGVLLVDVRIGEHTTFDRVTFEFDSGLPGYSVQYVEPPIIADPSGMEVEIEGAAFILIRMEPAAGHDPNTGDETYTGGLELKPALPSLLEAERTGDFEAVLNWVLGLSEEVDFRVTTLDGPPRLVVDVEHP